MQVYLDTLGCRLNEAELGRWARGFRDAGHHVVRQPELADVCVLNTCAVTASAVRKSRKATRALHRRNPRARLVLTGCQATLDPASLAELAGVDLILDNRHKDQLVGTVLDAFDVPTMPAAAADPDASNLPRRRTRAFVKVQDGCRNRCTFCIVTVARGAERSRTAGQVVDEIGRLHDEGYREAVISGVHLGGWGSDLGARLGDLLDAILERTHIPWIRLGSLEPWELQDDFFDRWSDPRLAPHLHLPVQTGSDSVLKRMARRGSVDGYRRLFAHARAAGIRVTTDLIVGFPGETQAELEQTAAFVDEQAFDDLHLFTYSPREGTAAARMAGQHSDAVKAERSERIRAIVARHRTAFLEDQVGTARRVHWEGHPVRTDRGLRWSGYTDHYVRIETEAPDGLDLTDRIEPVRVDGVARDALQAIRLSDQGEQLA